MASLDGSPGSSKVRVKLRPLDTHQTATNASTALQQPLVFHERVVVSPSSGKRKIVLSCRSSPQSPKKLKTDDMSTAPKCPSRSRKNKNNKNHSNNNSSRPNTPATNESVSDSDMDELSELTEELDSTSQIEGTAFEIEVKTSLRRLTTAFFGNKKMKEVGLIKRIVDIEKDIYGDGENEAGLKARVETLENITSSTSVISATASSSSDEASAVEVTRLQTTIKVLQQSNAFLTRVASRLQAANKSLHNEQCVQKNRQNYLNLHLGSVSPQENKSCKEEAAQFFQEILGLPQVKPSAFVKVYRKSKPHEFDETIKSDDGSPKKIHVTAPGVMFVGLESEFLRDQAMGKAQGLGGQRHAEFNYKYFVSSVECEATRATKDCHHVKIRDLVIANKNKPEGQKVHFQVRGDDFIVGGQLQKDFLQPPSEVDVTDTLSSKPKELEALRLYHSMDPLSENGNQFIAYAVRCRTMDKICLGYIKTYLEHPTASHVMMAYRIGPHTGSCDNGECKADGVLLKLVKSKNLKNVGLYVVCISNGQHLGQKWFDLISQVAEELLDFLLVNLVVTADHPPLVDSPMELHSSQDSGTG